MKPAKREFDYERVSTEDLVSGIIEDVQYEETHSFKGFQGAPDKVAPGIRFKFKLEGYSFPHYSRWMKFNYGAKANLFTKYLVALVEGAVPDMDFDLDQLKGLAVKTLWSEKNGFQNLETIRPAKGKIVALSVAKSDASDEF